METVLVADKCYPYIAKMQCRNCGRQFLAGCTDDGVRCFGNVCGCNEDYAPVEGYPSYSEWREIRRNQKERH